LQRVTGTPLLDCHPEAAFRNATTTSQRLYLRFMTDSAMTPNVSLSRATNRVDQKSQKAKIMSHLEYKPPTIEELRSQPWKAVIKESGEPTCSEYGRRFCSLASEEQDPAKKQVWWFFARLTTFGSSLDEGDERFNENVALFLDEDIKLMKEISDEIDNSELKARVCDIIWTRRRTGHFAYVQLAIRAYLNSAKALKEQICVE